MKKIAFVVLLVLVGAYFGIREHVRRLDNEVRLHDVTAAHDRLQNELSATKHRLEQIGHRASEAELQAASLKDDFSRIFPNQSGLADTAARARAPGAATTGASMAGWSVGGPNRHLGSFSLRPSSRRSLETTYHALYRQLKLSTDQIEQFKAVMIDSAARFEDLQRDARVKHLSPRDRAMQFQFAQANAALRDQLSGKFGAEALPVIEHFSETLFLRDTIGQLTIELFYSDAPLSQSQADQLVEIMAKNMRDPAGRLNATLADMTSIKAEGEKVLAPTQRKIWHEFIDYEAKDLFGAFRPSPR